MSDAKELKLKKIIRAYNDGKYRIVWGKNPEHLKKSNIGKSIRAKVRNFTFHIKKISDSAWRCGVERIRVHTSSCQYSKSTVTQTCETLEEAIQHHQNWYLEQLTQLKEVDDELWYFENAYLLNLGFPALKWEELAYPRNIGAMVSKFEEFKFLISQTVFGNRISIIISEKEELVKLVTGEIEPIDFCQVWLNHHLTNSKINIESGTSPAEIL